MRYTHLDTGPIETLPKTKSRSAPFGSRRRAARKLNQHKTKFEERTGQPYGCHASRR
ncbi:unnamed protein product [Ectocarpus sp. CCAP 1310/34]|nr:unnamed protein product [Ectocarpus sp. CCAP 1310/34]